MNKIVCISDTHNMHSQVNMPDGDILIHAGDFLGRGTLEELSSFLDWLERQPYRLKLVVPGNHDVCLETNLEARKEFGKIGAVLLIDEEYKDDETGLNFYGCPWTPDFFPDNWAFQYRDAGCTYEQIWEKVPAHTDILISHGPPLGVGDQVSPISSPHLGSPHLMNRIEELKYNLGFVVCGHIHGGYGSWCTDYTDPLGVHIVNASVCTERYEPTNVPLIIDSEDTWPQEM